MPSRRPFDAEVLHASAAGFAALVTEQLVEASPTAFDQTPVAFWRDSLESWVVDLGAAVADGAPETFVRQMEWTRWALRSRGVDDGVLRDVLVLLRAVLAEELPDGAKVDADVALADAIAGMDVEPSEVPPGIDVEAPHGRLAAQYVLALLEGDRRAATSLVLDAVSSGVLDVAEAYARVLAPAQRELGRMWHLNEGSIAEEHFVTSTTTALMARLMASVEPPVFNGKVVVATAVGGDMHDVGIRMVADLFELDGWRVVFLGANVPAADIGHAVRAFAADLLVVSATLGNQRRDVGDAIDVVRTVAAEAGLDCRILVGGSAFSGPEQLWRNAGADGTSTSARGAVVEGRRLVGLDG